MERKGRSEHLRYRYGICLNDGCSKCKSKEVQQIAARKELVCAECGKPLRECPPPKSWWDKNGKMVIGLVVLVVIAACVVLAFLLPGGCNRAQGNGQDTTTVDTAKVDTTKRDTTKVDTTKIDTVKVDTPKVKKNPGPTPPPVKKDPTYGTVSLGYGTYTGDLKNGKPHGRGTIVYRKTHRIVDSKDFYANPGDRYEGDFRDGRISSMGTWYHDGNQTAVKP